MRRNLLGIIAAGLLLAGFVGLTFGYTSQSVAGMSAGVGVRAGLILGALWLAYPQLAKMFETVPTWLFVTIAIGVGAVILRFRNIVFVGPILAVIIAMHYAARVFLPSSKRAKP